MRNINVGIMGHVDSGKTTIARWLSEQASTAAFDKSPQSQSRGITLDLGFSSLLLSKSVRVTFVDCPGHAALFRNVIGAANVIDAVLLVVDGTKGVQTQTAECIVLASIVTKHLIVAVNKIDMVENQEEMVGKLKRQLQSILTCFTTCNFVLVSAKANLNKTGLVSELNHIAALIAPRDNLKSFIMAIDHGFTIKGQGTILTATILQGQLSINDQILIPDLPTPAKVKSMQSFKEPIKTAIAGDRIGCAIESCSVKIERSVAVKTEQMRKLSSSFLMSVKKVPFFKDSVLSKQRLHISVLHSTVLCKQIIFCKPISGEYEWVDELQNSDEDAFALVLLEEPILIPIDFVVIGSKMDINIESKSCRLSVHGRVVDNQVNTETFKLFKWKERSGVVDRVVDNFRAIGRGLVEKDGVMTKFVGWRVHFINTADNEQGQIQSTFGTTGKFNIATKSPRSVNEPFVMRFKKYPLQPGKPIKQ